eukprot:453201_1
MDLFYLTKEPTMIRCKTSPQLQTKNREMNKPVPENSNFKSNKINDEFQMKNTMSFNTIDDLLYQSKPNLNLMKSLGLQSTCLRPENCSLDNISVDLYNSTSMESVISPKSTQYIENMLDDITNNWNLLSTSNSFSEFNDGESQSESELSSETDDDGYWYSDCYNKPPSQNSKEQNKIQLEQDIDHFISLWSN